MDKEPITNKVEVLYVTQYQYPGDVWRDRFIFADPHSAKMDIKQAKEIARGFKVRYKYRIIKRETTIKEFEEEE